MYYSAWPSDGGQGYSGLKTGNQGQEIEPWTHKKIMLQGQGLKPCTHRKIVLQGQGFEPWTDQKDHSYDCARDGKVNMHTKIHADAQTSSMWNMPIG